MAEHDFDGRHLAINRGDRGLAVMNRRPGEIVLLALTGVILASWSVPLTRAEHRRPADAILDQESPHGLYAFNGGACCTWQQGVTAGISGPLIGVELQKSTQTGSTFFFINVGQPWQKDANDFEAIISLPHSGYRWSYFDVSSANIYLEAGDQFVIGFGGRSGGENLLGNIVDAYPGGSLWLNGSERPTYDLTFRTYTIPEPDTLALTAVAALILMRRRR